MWTSQYRVLSSQYGNRKTLCGVVLPLRSLVTPEPYPVTSLTLFRDFRVFDRPRACEDMA